MTTIAPERPEIDVRPGLSGFLALCKLIEFPIEAFQRKIAAAFFGSHRELLVLLPRGNGKSRLIATLALHHLLVTDRPAVYVAASSREQARIVYEYARDAAEALDVEDLVVRHLELRVPGGHLRVLASDAPKLHGLTPSMFVIDELQAAKDDSVYLAARTSLQKRPGAKMITISTAGTGAESPLGQLRARALGLPDVRRRGGLVDARGGSLRMLEWAVESEVPIGDTRAAKMANPGSWQTVEGLREQREALPELAFRRYHLNQWVGRMGSWLPAGAWQACATGVEFTPGEKVWVGVDVGGARAHTAVVWLNQRLQIGSKIFSGEDGILDAAGFVPELAERYSIVEIMFDPWRAAMLVRAWEQRGIKCTAFQQSDSRMIPASAALHRAIVERKISHADDPKLNEHIAGAVARSGRRGWRIDQAERGTPVDGAIALCMAHEAATAPEPPPTRILGWL